MHFCNVCDNKYYIRIDNDDANKLIYYCRNCGNEDTELTVDNVSISKIQMNKGEQSFAHIINKYTKLDPTLPRVSKILCPNHDCETNVHPVDNEREIIYIRYDNTNMKYIYLCSTCDTVWKADQSA